MTRGPSKRTLMRRAAADLEAVGKKLARLEVDLEVGHLGSEWTFYEGGRKFTVALFDADRMVLVRKETDQ